MKKLFIVLLLLSSSDLFAEGNKDKIKAIKMTQGLQTTDTVVGKGDEAEKGKTVSVHYTGWLDDKGSKGKKFDSSLDRGQAFKFVLGQGMVIKGWDQGFEGMKVGGKRTLMIPAELGYGQRGAGAAIPPNADLIFDVELLEVN